MGRKKLDIKKIEEASGRKTKFSKRCPGLIKKAYELSVLTVTDGVVITSNPSDGKLSYFSLIRPEDALLRYLNIPDDKRRIVIPNKDSLIDKLQNCKIQDDMAVDEEISTEQGNNSKPITSGDNNQFIQHAELINYQYGVFRQKIHDINRFCQMATAYTSDQLDDYEEMLKALTSNIEQTASHVESMLNINSIREGPSSSHEMIQPPEMQQHQQSILVQANASFANMQPQQQHQNKGKAVAMEPNPASIHRQQVQGRPHNVQWQQQVLGTPSNIQLQQQGQGGTRRMQLQQQFQGGSHNMQFQQQVQGRPHNMQSQQQWASPYQNNYPNMILSTERSLHALIQTTQVTQPSAPIMPSPNSSWGSTYDEAGPSNYFHQQPFEEHGHDGNYMPDFDNKMTNPTRSSYHFPF